MNTETLRTFCLNLPGVTEDIKWDDHLCFSVGTKMFVITNMDGPLTASLKVSPEDFETLIARPDIKPSQYLARYHWVSIESSTALSEAEWEKLMRQSYELIRAKLPKKLQKELQNA